MHLAPLLTALVWSLGVGACSCGSEPEREPLTIFAAASLTEAFTALARDFEAAHPELAVQASFAGSQALRLQIEHGARADLFASANPRHMDALVDAGLVSDSRVFAHNELIVIVPRENPAGITSFEDLVRARRLVIGTAAVPVGAYARQMLKRAARTLGETFESQVLARVVSEESNVRLVRAKVELGEADAAIVYRTDALASSHTLSIEIPEYANVRAHYSIGQVSASPRAEAARAWIEYLHSEAARRVLARHGFASAP